ncbi:pseudouridine synthase [Ilyobacter polytropus]|uniref:Pseudouridine synthase n=1 Tax=Ilyobacter polytropus (strain ATCC 51220 / DSM 2926 / LMG 16218 / CuHBu1) TaxID=572544 RepID=E3H8E9_ILYPC|nr:pseudouridine synthase [Ilyobacter polytropus]ADO82716.1 ribosomal small subunit pseudouridine synthase A [Ilyobacter polytropus DSM 2926]
MRLDKFLTECGVGTRRDVKNIISKNEITINDKKVNSPKEKIDLENDVIKIGERVLKYKKDRFYIMNKTSGFITATEDTREKTVMELLPEWVIKKDLFPVGRLDKDTEGLLLFTNNGKIAHELLSPKKHVDKTYLVKLLKEIDKKSVNLLEEGVDIGGYITKPSKVQIINNTEILLTICEGKFHQVKKMLEAVGNKVIYLKRLSFGNLELGDLPLGEVKEVDLKDIF